MNRWPRALAFLVVVVISACKSSDRSDYVGDRCLASDKVGVPCSLPMAAVLAAPHAYEGRNVRLIGFMGGEADPGYLYMGRESWFLMDNSSALMMIGPGSAAGSHVDKNYSYVSVSGVMDGVIENRRQPNLRILVRDITFLWRPVEFSEEEIGLICSESAEASEASKYGIKCQEGVRP